MGPMTAGVQVCLPLQPREPQREQATAIGTAMSLGCRQGPAVRQAESNKLSGCVI